MTTPNEATKATTEAVAQWPKAAASSEADHVETLAQNSKAAVLLAKAEADRIRAESEANLKDREAARKHEAQLASMKRDEIKAGRKQAKADNRAARLAGGRDKAIGKGRELLNSIRGEAAASYSAFIYFVAASVAVGSQFVFFQRLIATSPSLSLLVPVSALAALLAAVFIEGFGLAFYSTSVASRLKNRSGWLPRLAAWGVTGFAAWLQYEAHRDLLVLGKPLVSYACAAASVGAMLLAEVRTTYKVGEQLEELDQKDRPQARLGVKFWLRYTRQAWWAWSAQIANPNIRSRTDALEAGQRLAQLRDKADLDTMLMREAQRALRAAQKKKGTSEAILFRLNELAYRGLDALSAQAQLSSAQSGPEATAQEAMTDRPSKAEATAQGLKATGRPKAQVPAQGQPTPRPKAEPAPASAVPAFEDWAEEAWADRPNGPKAWAQRVAELASVFPGDLPGRAEVIQTMKLRALDPELVPLRYSWTNKGYVGWAMADLKALRAERYSDPQPAAAGAEELTR